MKKIINFYIPLLKVMLLYSLSLAIVYIIQDKWEPAFPVVIFGILFAIYLQKIFIPLMTSILIDVFIIIISMIFSEILQIGALAITAGVLKLFK